MVTAVSAANVILHVNNASGGQGEVVEASDGATEFRYWYTGGNGGNSDGKNQFSEQEYPDGVTFGVSLQAPANLNATIVGFFDKNGSGVLSHSTVNDTEITVTDTLGAFGTFNWGVKVEVDLPSGRGTINCDPPIRNIR